MKRLICVFVLLTFCTMPVSAMEFTAPTAPDSAQMYMPEDTESFADGVWYIFKAAVAALQPDFAKASGICLLLIAAVLILSVSNSLTKQEFGPTRLVGAVVIGILMLDSVDVLIQMGANTVVEMSEYSKLLLPVMTAAVAAQGGTSTSAALYTGTVFFDSLLTTVIAKLVVPGVYVFLSLGIAECAVTHDVLKRVRKFVKWLMTWCLKIVLYVFTGYISVTGVISGSVDASVLKATKLTISGMVPVVGGILADASETVLLSAGFMKNTAGLYGIFALIAVCVNPFLQIGCQYALMKITCGICSVFGYKPAVELMDTFSTGMGIVLAMTGTVCIMLLISIVCFMKGMNG